MKTPTNLEWITEHAERHSWCYTWAYLALCAVISIVLVTAPTWVEWVDGVTACLDRCCEP